MISTPDRSSGLLRCEIKGLLNNAQAYRLYVDSEAMILNLLRQTPRRSIWSYHQILEFAGGSPSRIWGGQYAPLDSMKRRARLPLPPYLFVSRVTGIKAELGSFQPSYIDMEYDITDDCMMMLSNSTISSALMIEASHVAIMLFSYMGIDLVYDQEITYRILDVNTIVHRDLPVKGETFQGRLEFSELVKSGAITLVKTKFFCYSRNELVLTIDLLGGFFTENDLAANKGIQAGNISLASLPKPNQGQTKLRRDQISDMRAFSDGDYGPLLCPVSDSDQVERFFVHPLLRMLDRLVDLDYSGGRYGLGKAVVEKDIDENFWAFKAHFLNDPVFPGCLHIAAFEQMQILFALNAGYVDYGKYRLSSSLDKVFKCIFRGQVKPITSTIRYVQQLKEITKTDSGVILVSDFEVFWQGYLVSKGSDFTLVVEELD